MARVNDGVFGDDETPLMMSGRGQERSGSQSPFCHCLANVLRPCVAEATGVCLFVFLGSLSGLSNNIVAIAMAHGLTIMLLVIGFGSLSGGHFNPCVSIGASLGGAISPVIGLFYILAQLIGSIIGSALVRGILPGQDYITIDGGIPGLGNDVTVWQGILCEMTLTFLLVLMVLMTAVDTKDNTLAPVAIGLSVAVDILAAGSISGAVMNPARAFGPTVVGSAVLGAHVWSNHYVYWVGPITGSLLAAIFYRFAFASTNKRLLCTA